LGRGPGSMGRQWREYGFWTIGVDVGRARGMNPRRQKAGEPAGAPSRGGSGYGGRRSGVLGGRGRGGRGEGSPPCEGGRRTVPAFSANCDNFRPARASHPRAHPPHSRDGGPLHRCRPSGRGPTLRFHFPRSGTVSAQALWLMWERGHGGGRPGGAFGMGHGGFLPGSGRAKTRQARRWEGWGGAVRANLLPGPSMALRRGGDFHDGGPVLRLLGA